MKKADVRQFLLAYGMLGVLLVLCGFFAVATYHMEVPVGQEGGESLATDILALQPRPASVVIVVTPGDSDKEFADALEKRFAQEHLGVAARIAGNPPDARQELEKLAAAGHVPDTVATTVQARDWAVWNALKTQYPAFAQTKIISPTGGKRSTFLSPGNLRNIADQIAVIAILAVGMTLVILTGGIDLIGRQFNCAIGGGNGLADPRRRRRERFSRYHAWRKPCRHCCERRGGRVFRSDDYALSYPAVYRHAGNDAGGERAGVYYYAGAIPVRHFPLLHLARTRNGAVRCPQYGRADAAHLHRRACRDGPFAHRAADIRGGRQPRSVALIGRQRRQNAAVRLSGIRSDGRNRRRDYCLAIESRARPLTAICTNCM